MSRHFVNEAGETYTVPDAEVDGFLKEAASEGLKVSEVANEPVKTRHFKNEAGETYTVPETEVDGFLKEAASEGLKVSEFDELNGEAGKEDIGVFEQMKLEKEAQLGKKLSTGETVASYLPGARLFPEMEANRNEASEQRLYSMEIDDPMEMVRVAKSIGLDEAKIQEIVDAADSGVRSIGGFRLKPKLDVMKQGFRDLVEPKMVERIKAREEAKARLANAKELGWWDKVGKGTLQMAAPLAEMTNPVTIAAEAAAGVINRTGRMGHDVYTLDENGKPVIAKGENGNELRGERGEGAAFKAVGSSIADQAIWITPVVGKLLKKPIALVANKTPGLNKLLAGAMKGGVKELEKATAKLEKSEAGRLLIKTGEVLGKVEEKLHFGNLPGMMMKTRASELLDNVLGTYASADEKQSFSEWFENFTSVEGNAELFTQLIGAWGITAAASAAKAHAQNKAFRQGNIKAKVQGREETVAEYIGAERAKKLSNQDLDMLYRIVTSEGLTVEKVDGFLSKISNDAAEAQKRVDAGATPEEVWAAFRDSRGDTSAVEGALKGLKGELEERRTITPEMEQALDERIALYSDGQESVARAIKEDFRKNLTDNKVFDDADALEEMVAMSARKFEPETRRLKIHDLRGSAMTEAEKVVGIKDLGIETVEDAEREGLVSLDQYGRLTGGATEALKIVVHGTERMRGEVAEGRVSGRLAGEIIDFAETQMGSRERVERTELIDSILDNAQGDESTAKAIIARLAEDDGRGTVAERVAKATIAVKEAQLKARHPDADGETVRGAMVEPVETADGRMTTLAETMDVKGAGENGAPRAPQGALEGVEQAARTKATKLQFAADGAFRCAAFPELAVRVSSAGVELNGFTPQGIADPAKAAEVAAVLAQAVDVARRNGVKIVVDEVHRPVVEALIGEIKREGLAKTQAKLDTRAKLFSLLFKTTLGNGVTYDEASFRKALEETSNGRRFIDNHGDIYGLVDGNNVLHFNPGVINFNTPIHEYGHLALDTIKGINRKLWQQGMDLIKDSEYYRDIERQSNDAESPYAYMKGRSDDICDEALATLIGDRGEKLVLDKGLEAKLKEWLKEVWKAFKGVFGLGDLSDEQVEKMTLDEFVNVVNAELLSGREFGTKKKAPPTERSVKRYDESAGSGSNGLLRWRNDRGYLLAIPVDMERTQPGGKIVFATDDADITDYIQLALNGIELRLSKSGKIYVKGRNGLPAELAEIFGKYPTIGQNDGIREELASALGNGAYANATVAELVDALKADRANYDEWVKAQDKGKSLEDQRQEAHYADEAAREEAEARERWENSGMGVLDYIRSRAEEGVPEFDLDWEIAREMARDFEEGRFSIGGFHGAVATGKVGLLREADKLEKSGASREDIWRTTGWWRGKDGKWRVELPDIKMRSKREIELAVKLHGNSISLEELVDAPELFKAYPALAETRIILDKDYFSSWTKGSYDPASKDITLNNKGQISLADLPYADRDSYDTAQQKVSSDDFLNNFIETSNALGIKVGTFAEEREKAKAKIEEIEKRIAEKNRERLKSLDSDETRSILAHEIQHAIQRFEGFARGGSPESVVDFIKEMRRKEKVWSYKLEVEEMAKKLGTSNPYEIEKAILEMLGAKTHEQIKELEKEGWIPDKKGRDKGYNLYARGYDKEGYEDAWNEYLGKMRESGSTVWWDGSPHELYARLAGEVESRNVQKRLDMSPEERATIPPWETEDVPETRQIVRFQAARPAMSALAKAKVGESVEGVTADSLRNAIKTKIENGIQDGEFRFKKPEDKSRLVSEAVRFYKRFSQKTVMLSDGRCVYFVPDARAKAERGLSNDEAWAEYAIHAVTSSGQKIPGKDWNERLYNKTKAANIWRIENILKAERCEAKLSDDPEKLGVVFFGRGVDGRTIQIITRLDDRGNILADLSEVTVITGKKEKNLPPHKPLAEAVEAVAHKLRGGLLTVNENILPQNAASAQGHFSVGGRNDWKDIDLDIFEFRPGMETTAMGETEQSAAGLAGAREQREALRPWTKPQSPADLAKPIAFDAADLILFWRAVSGSLRNPHVQKGKRIAGHKGAIGLNIGGDRIEIVSRLFGVLDEGDRKKLMEECRADGFFRNEDADWCAARGKSTIAEEEERSRAELARRTAELYKRRVETGEGGEHYAAEVLAHEIGHTLGKLKTAANLGPVGEAAKTLYDALTRELERKVGGARKVGEAAKTIKGEVENLIAWWHGQEKMPEYYAEDEEMFAELFGIFLTQPESVQAMAPRAYDTCVKLIAGNEKLAAAYRKMSELKWSGAANDRVMAEVRKTWDAAAQRQYRELNKMTKESISLKRDWFNFVLINRFGPMFAISRRSLAAEKKRLQKAVKSGDMSEQEAADRIKAKEDEINALKTSLYNWQRQSGGQTRLMIAGFDDVRAQAEREGVSWSDVRDFAHNMRVIELGGRATAHGITPARAAVILEEMKKRLGSAAYSNVEKTWKAFRAVYERSVLDDPNVRELFDADTMKMLEANKHYVTMRHRMGVEEAADWEQKIKKYRKKNSNAWDPCIDIQERLNKGLGASAGEGSAFVLHHLVGSFEATEDPIAATIRRAIEIKESAARNHLIKQTSETLRMLGAKGVFDTVAGTKPAKVDPNVYGKLTYMDGGEKHELIVPRVVYQSFKADPMSFGAFGAAMRTIRNTMTLWNPMFVNRAYLIDRAGLETNIKGLHKAPIDILSEAFSIRGIGVPLYMVNNYLARFTPICNSWLGKLLWNENTVNHYAHRAQKIASIVYEGRFGERIEEAKRLRELGETGKAQEIEENLAIAQEMLRRNVFQSAYRFNKQQAGFDTDEIMRQFGYRIEGGANPRTWRARLVEGGKTAGRWWTRYGEEQEAVTKIIAYLYEMKKGAAADEAARTTIEMGGTPNLAARGVWASYVENATGFFWNVRKEASLRTIRAIKDHPTEWIVKNFAQTAVPAVLKGMMLTGALEMLIRNLFDDDEEKVQQSWWAAPVINHARFMNEAMKCVPGYHQRNYNVIPLAKFGDEVLSMRVKYSPEEFAIQNLVHTMFQKFGADPTDPDADFTTLNKELLGMFSPDVFGRNYALDLAGVLIGPMVGFNPYDSYRQRNVYDQTTWEARWSAPGNMATEIVKNFWNYSPIASFTTTFKNNQERKLEDSDVPAWLDAVVSTPVIGRLPASMLSITSGDSYLKALERGDKRERAYARLKAADVLEECIKRGRLGGFQEGLKGLSPELQRLAIRHVINGWRRYHMDPRAENLRKARNIKDPKLRIKAQQWIEDSMRYGD